MNPIQKCAFLFIFFLTNIAHADPLPSWNNTPNKKNIIEFVQTITDKTNKNYVPRENRIATFDNDGTLWVEQPMYTEGFFVFDQIKSQASQHPEWKTTKPYSAVLSSDHQALTNLSTKDIATLVAETHSNMTIEAFNKAVKHWLATTKDHRYHHYYTQLIYQPMLEVMNYLRENNFTVYIVSGGGQEFVRAFSQPTYQVPVDHVIGSTVKTKYLYQNKQPALIKMPEILFIDDHAGKPEAINLFIGQKPLMAFGNSNGDQQMLEWTQSGSGKRFMMLIHHDDQKREYAYGPDSKVGTFSNALMSEAVENHWHVVSMKNDWKVIFPFDKDKK